MQDQRAPRNPQTGLPPASDETTTNQRGGREIPAEVYTAVYWITQDITSGNLADSACLPIYLGELSADAVNAAVRNECVGRISNGPKPGTKRANAQPPKSRPLLLLPLAAR
jgi:hypothetical protein